jgi:pilus assembly protein CpaE
MAKVETSDLLHNFTAFVLDPVSEHVVNSVIKNMQIDFAEVKQGGIGAIIEYLKDNRTPKILLADLSDSELPLSDIAKIMESCIPSVKIVTIGSRNDVGLFRDLKAMGVSDYITKPLNNIILRKAIEIASGFDKGYVEKIGKMFYFVSVVGGAGSTTVASNVGWLLTNRHFKRAAILDMYFLYGTVNLMLDIKADNAYLDILESQEKVDDYFVETIFKKYDQRLYYLGGLVDLLRGSHVNGDAFESLINIIKRQFNYTLVDAQREIGGANRVCMKKSDGFVVVIEMSVAAAQNAVRMLEFLESDQSGKRIFIVANKVGLSVGGALSKEAFEKIINRRIDCVMPLDETVALAAANIGQPLVMSGSPLTDMLENLTDNIVGKVDNQKDAQITEGAKKGFNVFGKIMSKFKK